MLLLLLLLVVVVVVMRVSLVSLFRRLHVTPSCQYGDERSCRHHAANLGDDVTEVINPTDGPADSRRRERISQMKSLTPRAN